MPRTTCKNCSILFDALQADLNRGRAQFCSISCSSRFAGEQRRAERVNNAVCAFCDVEFYRAPSKLKNSKSGLSFCGRECKERAQSDISFGISPAHYGGKKSVYRSLALKHYGPSCKVCGYDNASVVQVHHRDKDRENNELENLVVLCPTCHVEVHKGFRRLEDQDGCGS